MKIIFKDQGNSQFFPTVRARVENYFKENNLSKFANRTVYIKCSLFFFLYAAFYTALISDYFSDPAMILLFIGIGIMKGLVGFNTVHDALHGAYSSKQYVNKAVGYLFDFIGLSSYAWKYTHNLMHHTYTNIPGHDVDIDKAILLRLSPKDTLYRFHKFQYLYAPFLYCLLGCNWMFYSDYVLFFDLMKQKKVPKHEIILFFVFKLINATLFVILPFVLLQRPFWLILLGFFCLQFFASFLISLVFQLAHIVENVEFPSPDSDGVIHNNWCVHEMVTTSDFATQNRFLTYILGGLNFQVEHHLFSQVCHIHYPAIQKIVKKTAEEFQVPYNENPTFLGAVGSHFSKLKQFGRSAEVLESELRSY